MAFTDLFKPKIQHSSPQDRIEALIDIKNQKKVGSIVLNDPSFDVKKKAITQLNNTGVIKTLLFPGNQQKKLPDELVSQLFHEMSKKNLIVIFFTDNVNNPGIEKYTKYIKDDKIFVKIFSKSKNKKIIKIFFEKLTGLNFQIEEMTNIILASGNKNVIKIFCRESKNINLLKDICLKTNDTEIVRISIQKINDIDFLIELADKKKSTRLKKAIKKRVDALKPLYYEYKVQKDCPECGYPVMVNGPLLKTVCNTCDSLIHIGSAYWKNFLKQSVQSGVFIMGQRVGDKPGVRKDPMCHKCGSNLPVNDIDYGNDRKIICRSCKTPHQSYPSPDWMKKIRNSDKKKPVYIFCADKEGEPETVPGKILKPIAFNCINCSSPLEFNLETPRIMECRYCGTQQYLPNALWHALHPVKKIRPWYILYT